MGSSPKTKSEIRNKIATLQYQIEQTKLAPNGQGKKSRLANLRAEIARLRAQLPDAPK